MLEAGVLLGGRYELLQRIARGGMGEVWKAQDRILGRRVAVKVVKSGLADDGSFRERFRTEARLSARLSHGNIAQVHDFGEDDGTAYLVMELVDGSSVADLLAHGPVPLSSVDQVIREAAAGLDAAHEWGMVHRDVKPANLLLTAKGAVKVTDFGIARALGEAKVTRTGEVLGTVQYMAPEVATGQEAGAQSDVYALAVVAYELLSGRRPFHADSAVTLALKHVNDPPPPLPDFVPGPVSAVVMRGLAKNPTHRPRGAAGFARELSAAAAAGTTPWTPAASTPMPAASSPYSPPQPGIGYGGAQAAPSAGPYGYNPGGTYAPAHPGAYAPMAHRLQLAPGAFSRWVWTAWIVFAVLTALACFLPIASHAGESWSYFEVADPTALKGEERDETDNLLGWLLAIPMLLVAALAVPGVLGKAYRALPLVAIPGCLWSCLIFLAAWGSVTSTPEEPSPAAEASGAFVVPLMGTLTLVAVVTAAIKPR